MCQNFIPDPGDIATLLPTDPSDIATLLPTDPRDIATLIPTDPSEIIKLLPTDPSDIATLLAAVWGSVRWSTMSAIELWTGRDMSIYNFLP